MHLSSLKTDDSHVSITLSGYLSYTEFSVCWVSRRGVLNAIVARVVPVKLVKLMSHVL